MGRQMARVEHRALGACENPEDWTDDDVLFVLSRVGSNVSGSLILGNAAYEGWLARKLSPLPVFRDEFGPAYEALAERAIAGRTPGSSAAGEFPKFAAMRDLPDARTRRSSHRASVVVRPAHRQHRHAHRQPELRSAQRHAVACALLRHAAHGLRSSARRRSTDAGVPSVRSASHPTRAMDRSLRCSQTLLVHGGGRPAHQSPLQIDVHRERSIPRSHGDAGVSARSRCTGQQIDESISTPTRMTCTCC